MGTDEARNMGLNEFVVNSDRPADPYPVSESEDEKEEEEREGMRGMTAAL